MDGLPLAWTAEYVERRDQALRAAIADPDLLERFSTGASLPPAFGRGVTMWRRLEERMG